MSYTVRAEVFVDLDERDAEEKAAQLVSAAILSDYRVDGVIASARLDCPDDE